MKNKVTKSWKRVSVGEIGDLSAGGTPNTKTPPYWKNGTIRWMTSGEIHQKRIFEVNNRITEAGYKNSSAKLLPKKTILIALAGQGKTRGTVAITEIELTTNQSVGAVQLNQKMADPMFVFYNLDSRYQELRSISLGDGRAGLNLEILRRLPLCLPPLPEQKKIARILSTWDRAIEALGKLTDTKTRLKKGLMQKLLTEKVQFKNGAWKTLTIADCCEILDTKRKPLNEMERSQMRGEIPYYGANGLVDYVNDYIFDEELILTAEDGGYFDEYATRPIAYLISGKSWVNNHAHVLKAKPGFCQRLIFYNLVHKNLSKYLNSGTRSKLNRGELEKIEFDLPVDFDQQKKIADILCSMDRSMEIAQNLNAQLKTQKQGLMQKLLTGKIRVKV